MRSSRTALCLWLPTFELRLELVRSPELDRTSVALLSPSEGVRREVWQVSERGAEAGAQPGMLVSQAISLCPSLTLLEPDPAHYDTAHRQMLEAVGAWSPIVEPAGRGRIFVGVDGLARLLGPPRRQVERILASLLEVFPAPLVAAVRAGYAPGKFGAWVAATTARPGEPAIVDPESSGSLRAFLAPRPVSSLPLEDGMVERLERLGIATLGDLARFPEPALVRQLGAEGRNALAWATGTRIDPVRPFLRAQPIRVSLDFPAPVGQADALRAGIDRLLERALARPERRGRSVRALRLTGQLEGSGSWTVEATLKDPTADLRRIGFVLRSRIELTPPPRAVHSLDLEIHRFGPPTTQSSLFDRKEGAGRDRGRAIMGGGGVKGRGTARNSTARNGTAESECDVLPALRSAVKELRLRLGHAPLYRVVEVDPTSRIPERRHALLELDSLRGNLSRALQPLNTPEPVEVKAKGRHDEPVELRAGRRRWRVSAVRERWRIDDEWWRRPIAREYHALVLEDGRPVTVYHDLVRERWYVQGEG